MQNKINLNLAFLKATFAKNELKANATIMVGYPYNHLCLKPKKTLIFMKSFCLLCGR